MSVTVEDIILNINILGCTVCISSHVEFCCEFCFAGSLLLVWYDHVMNECFTENMNIAIVPPPLAYNNTFMQVYSFKRHVDVVWNYMDCTWKYDASTSFKEEYFQDRHSD